MFCVNVSRSHKIVWNCVIYATSPFLSLRWFNWGLWCEMQRAICIPLRTARPLIGISLSALFVLFSIVYCFSNIHLISMHSLHDIKHIPALLCFTCSTVLLWLMTIHCLTKACKRQMKDFNTTQLRQRARMSWRHANTKNLHTALSGPVFHQCLTCSYLLTLLNLFFFFWSFPLSMESVMPPPSSPKQDKHFSCCYAQEKQITFWTRTNMGCKVC